MTDPGQQVSVPVPFLFNPLKHHRGFIRSFVHHHAVGWPANRREVMWHLRLAGRLMMDLYTGNYSVEQVLDEIGTLLGKRRLLQVEAYREWIVDTEKRFRILQIADGSRWTMLLSIEGLRYIHIHPARNSLHSTRIKALPLKTAILLQLEGMDPSGSVGVKAINRIRAEYLGEAPVKDGRDTKNTRRIHQILFA